MTPGAGYSTTGMAAQEENAIMTKGVVMPREKVGFTVDSETSMLPGGAGPVVERYVDYHDTEEKFEVPQPFLEDQMQRGAPL